MRLEFYEGQEVFILPFTRPLMLRVPLIQSEVNVIFKERVVLQGRLKEYSKTLYLSKQVLI